MKTATKGRAGGWLLIFGGLGMALVLWLVPAAGASSNDPEAMARRDFDGLVRAVASQYHVHAKAVPMMWLANLCARSVTGGGVHGMKVVQFEDAGKMNDADRSGLRALVQGRLGERWSPLVRQHEAKGGDSFVYAQNDDDGRHTRLIVLDLDGAELDMVSVAFNPEQLAKWMKEQDVKDGRTGSAAGSEESE